jgi:hypothetical protein
MINDIKQALLWGCIGAILGFLLHFILVPIKSEPYNRYKWHTLTNTYYTTNYGKVIDYIKIPIENYINITNFWQITNIKVIISNKIEKITVTNIIEIIKDYSGFMESPFIFIQSNNDLTVRIYKREGYYKIRFPEPAKHRISLYYPLMLNYQYRIGSLFGMDFLTAGAYIGLLETNKFIAGVGIGIEF